VTSSSGRDYSVGKKVKALIYKEQIAHDLAVGYITNRYGVDVSGDFSVYSLGDDITGSGSVKTEHLPDVNEPKRI